MTYLALAQEKNMTLDTGTNRAFPLPAKFGSLISHWVTRSKPEMESNDT